MLYHKVLDVFLEPAQTMLQHPVDDYRLDSRAALFSRGVRTNVGSEDAIEKSLCQLNSEATTPQFTLKLPFS
jgi:hypothetical protein